MSTTNYGDDEQRKLWNGPAGHAWVEGQATLDQMFLPFEQLLTQTVSAASARQVLDIGCGTGSTTFAVARVIRGQGQCTGIDISEPMLAAARQRAEREGVPAHFIRGDAEFHPFSEASCDAIISRFGVMFFADPIHAFANLRRAAADHAALCLIAWRSPAENAFMTTAERAAAPLLPNLPPRRPDGPGQFAFANADRVRVILEKSGWTDIDISPLDVECTLPESELHRYVTRLGPVGLFLQDADQQTRTKVIDAVFPSFAPYIHGGEVRFTAACWMVGARAE